MDKFGVSEKYYKDAARNEIETGVEEFFKTSKMKEGITPELADLFKEREAEKPLARRDVELGAGGLAEKD